MSQDEPSREQAERAMRQLLADHDLPEPDEILDHEDGGIVCLWHEPKVAVVVDLEPRGRCLGADASSSSLSFFFFGCP